MGFPGGSGGKESACSAGDLDSIPGLGRCPGGGHGNPLQYSCMENPMDRGAWQAMVHRVTKIWTWLKRLSTMVAQWKNLPAVQETWVRAPARRFPGERNGNPLHYLCWRNPMDRRSLVGYDSWGRKESDVTERLNWTKLNRSKLLHTYLKQHNGKSSVSWERSQNIACQIPKKERLNYFQQQNL